MNMFSLQTKMAFIIKQEELILDVDTKVVNCDWESDVKAEASFVKIEAEDPLKNGRCIFHLTLKVPILMDKTSSFIGKDSIFEKFIKFVFVVNDLYV